MKALLIFACCLLLLTGCAKKHDPYVLKYPVLEFTPPDLASHRHVLDNGVTVFVVEDQKLPLFDIHARFRTGGLMETEP
jgi:hypothetical protein